MKITLPYPPSANVYWRNWRGRMVVSSEARQYKLDIATLARLAKVKPITGDVLLMIEVFRPRKAGDLGNRLKIVEDALQGIAYADDKQVSQIIMCRHDDHDNPRIVVQIERATAVCVVNSP